MILFYFNGEFASYSAIQIFCIDSIALPHGFNFYLNEDTNYQLKKDLKDTEKIKEIF